MLALLLACAQPETEVLLTGWEYEWAELSHRVAYLRVGVDADEQLSLGLVGGDWSTGEAFVDTPHYRVRYQQVAGSGLHVVRGTATLLVGPGPTASTTLELDATDLPQGHAAVAVIDGFTIDTDVAQGPDYPSDYDPAYGYTSNGFGFALGDVTREGDTFSVPVEATVRWGPQDRDDVNEAIPHAVTGVEVDVAVIVGPSEPEVVAVSAERPYVLQERPFTDQPPMETPVSFEGGAREGLVAWRSFDLALNLDGPSVGEGDYLRAFGAELVPGEVEPGGFSGTVTATLSTSSLSEWSDPHAAFRGELVRMGSPDVVAEHWVVSGSHPTGREILVPKRQ